MEDWDAKIAKLHDIECEDVRLYADQAQLNFDDFGMNTVLGKVEIDVGEQRKMINIKDYL